MGGFGVEIFLLTVSEGLEIVEDEFKLTQPLPLRPE